MPNRQRWMAALLGHPASSPGGADGPAVLSQPAQTERAVLYLADLLADTRDELTRVDSKASLLLASVGVALGALVAGFTGGRWTPVSLSSSVQWLWWAGVLAAAVGVASISAAVYPQIAQPKIPHPGVPAYYGHVVAYRNIAAFREAIDQLPSMKERLIYQTFALSRIVQQKYVLLRRGLRCLVLAIVACTIAVLVSFLLGRLLTGL